MTDCSLDFDLISKIFLSKTQINVIIDYLSLHIKDLSCDENQEKLLNSSINHNLMNKYPLSLKYRQYFAKELLKLLEKHALNASETLSSAYALLLSETQLNKSSYNLNYLTYILSDGQTISLQESDNLVIDGTTGLKSWSAAKHLVHFIESNKCLVENKSVLELGSGIGLTGICILKTCWPSLLAFSDHHSVVLEVLQNNIQINNVLQKSRVYRIDWNEMQSLDNYLNDNNPDVIIAADVVFDPTLTVCLCRVLNQLLKDCNKTRVCYIGCSHRKEETVEHFYRLIADEYKLKIDKIYSFSHSDNDLKSFCFDSLNINCSVFKISK